MPANISANKPAFVQSARKEVTLFLVLTLVGMLVLPSIVYMIGTTVFGAYGNGGFATFYGTLHGEFRAGEPVVIFLMFAPYIIWQVLRWTVRGFRQRSVTGKQVSS